MMGGHKQRIVMISLYGIVTWGIFCILATWSHAEAPLEITAFEYPPFQVSERIPGKGFGFSIDVAKAAFNAVNIKSEFTFYPMIRSVLIVKNGEFHANIGSIKQFGEAEQTGEVIGVTIASVRFVFYYFPKVHGPITFEQLSELQGYSIGNVRGSATTGILTKARLEMDWASAIEQNFEKFMGGRFDLCVALELAGDEIIATRYPDRQADVAKIDTPILTVPLSVTFAKSHASLADQFKEGLAIIKANGTYADIADTYFGKGSLSKLE
jgi:polar amino acid transport system substrate-binding protein